MIIQRTPLLTAIVSLSLAWWLGGVPSLRGAEKDLPTAHGIARGTFQPPASYDLDTIYHTAKHRCPSRALACYEQQFDEITAAHGPQAAIDVLTKLAEQDEINEPTDGHHVAHHIGHHTAMAFGPTQQALALCPTSYNYGCMHGFFQHAIGMRLITPEGAAEICAEFERDPLVSFKHKAYCYHGVGHGVMVYESHHLLEALQFCDSLGTGVAQHGCWQGVFMENINGAQTGKSQDGLFSLADPLAPCSQLPERYHHQCLINHAGWLMKVFDGDLVKATEACLDAPGEGVTSCLESIGLMVTNPGWQADLLAAAASSFIKNAWTLCQRFPQTHVHLCVNGAIDNLMNFDALDLTRPAQFCQACDPVYRTQCFRRIGMNLVRLTPDRQTTQAVCETLDPEDQEACLDSIAVVDR